MTAPRRCAWTACAVLGLSVTGHLFGGGGPPSAPALVIVGILGLVLAALLAVAPRPPRALPLVGVLGAFQVIAHGILHEVTGATHVHAAGMAQESMHLHHLGSLGSLGQAAPPVVTAHPAVLTSVHGPSPLMLSTHLLATVLLAWLLGPAVRQVRYVLRRILPTVPVLGHPAVRPTVPAPLRRRPMRGVQMASGLRGPPRLACI